MLNNLAEKAMLKAMGTRVADGMTLSRKTVAEPAKRWGLVGSGGQ